MTGKAFAGFPGGAMKFLAELARNNERAWFAEHKQRYEELVREPALDFIQAMGQPIADIAPRFVAVPKKTGGSLMRPYRDTRFSKDKTPYKTNVGIQFRHEFAKDVHAPGFYVHIHPEEVFLAVGSWRPAPEALRAIRERIAEAPDAWTTAWDNAGFRRRFEPAGESLKRAPRGFDRDHPLACDLKRKDFVAVRNLDPAVVATPRLQREAAASFAAAVPLMQFLCGATGAPWD